MELTFESLHWADIIHEYKLASHLTTDFTLPIIHDVVMNFHPYNHLTYCSEDLYYYNLMRDDWHDAFRHYNLYNYILSQNENLQRSNITRALKRKNPAKGIYAITISPPPDVSFNILVGCVKKILSSKCVNMIYGVFELGRKSRIFHTHFLITFSDRNGFRNLEKKLKKEYAITTFDEMKGSTHLLKTLRYFHQDDKINRGFINTPHFEYFETITDSTAEVKFIRDPLMTYTDINK